MTLLAGTPEPLGATWDGHGVNFALFSEPATRVDLCLFDGQDAAVESRRIALPEQTDHGWHGHLTHLHPGQLYGYRVDGPYDPAAMGAPIRTSPGAAIRWICGIRGYGPANDVTAILCLESCRHQTRLVGENLGTVPTYVNDTLEAHRFGGLHVAQCLVRPGDTPPIEPAACGTVASLNTHDTATFAGYLNGTDIDDRVARGLLTAASAAVARRRRCDERTAIAESTEAGTSPADGPTELLEASLGRLARSRADMVLVMLEDLWLEPRPHNVPGTGPERANWRRRARYSVEEFTGMPEVRDTVRRVAEEQARGRRERLAGRELA